jgi:phosphoglycerate dehydrogenase-like enzyme
MNKLAILSRDAWQYHELIKQAQLPELELLWASNKPPLHHDFSSIDILLADPDLAAVELHHCETLKWLQSTWAGNAPLLNHPKRDYQLCGIKNLFGQKMREYVFAHLLYFSRNIAGFARRQASAQWQAPEFGYLAGKTIGIMGVGSIGKVVAQTAKVFDMHVRGLSYTSRDCDSVDCYFSGHELKAFAQGLDFLVCLLPQTKDTFAIIDQTFLNYLPSHCVLINAGRGHCIDEQALLTALRNKQIRAAVLDVTAQEPLPGEHSFWQEPNVILTQHTAAVSDPADISQVFIANYHHYVKEAELNYVLSFDKGY